MERRKSIFATIFILLVSISIIATLGVSSVSAQEPTPEIVVTPTLNTGVAGSYATYKFNIKNAPHIDYDGDPAYWKVEKTWAWQVELNWNATVLGSPVIVEDTYTVPGKTMSLLGFFSYWYEDPFMGWMSAPYPRSGLTKSIEPGKAVIFDGLKATPDVTTQPIYAGDPNKALHLGTKYDLPYSAGLTGHGYPDNELSLFWVRFTVLKDGPPAWSRIWINLGNTYFWCHDATTTYAVTPMDAWFGSKPIPEFPLGVGLMIALAPAIPIVYLWRTRRKVVKQ